MQSRRGRRGFRRAGDLSADRLEMPPARARELRLATAWRRVAGAAISGRALVRGVKRGVLEIEVPDERWAATLRDLIPRLAGRLVANYPDLGVKKLRIRLRGAEGTPLATTIPPVEAEEEFSEETTPSGAADRAPVEEGVPVEERLARLAERYLERSGRTDQKP